MKNKKILIFTNQFLPGYKAGGPVTSIVNLSALLENDFEIIIITSNKDFGDATPYEQIEYDKVVRYEKFNVVYLSTINASVVIEIINQQKPDLIYVNSFFSIFTQIVLFLTIKNKLNIPIILAPRGELQENALAIKALKKKIYLFMYKLIKVYRRVNFHATDKIEYARIQEMFAVNHITTLPNIPKVCKGTTLFKMKNELKIIFISRIRDNKNLLFALQSLTHAKGDIIFDIYGPIEDEIYWEDCKLAIQNLPNNIKAKYKGMVLPNEVSTVMQNYHALLLPTKTENFGHVIVEAMQSGLIPIISNQTPWLNLEENHAGWSLDLSNTHIFTKAIDTLYEMDEEEYSHLSKSTIKFIANKLKINELKQAYIQFFEKIIYK